MNILFFWVAQFVDQSSGMERVLCNFANNRNHKGDHVSVAYCTEVDGKPYFALDNQIGLYNLLDFGDAKRWESKPYLTPRKKIGRELIRLFNSRKAKDFELYIKAEYLSPMIRELLKKCKPDIIISFEPKSTFYMQQALKQLHCRVPLVTMFHFSMENAFDVSSEVEREAVLQSDCVQVLTQSDKQSLKQILPECHVSYIPNVVPQYKLDQNKKGNSHIILNVGRLDAQQKRQHILLEAFGKVAGDYPEWKVELLGEDRDGGQYIARLNRIISRYHLEDRVSIHKPVKDVLGHYQSAAFFAFPSAYEGFPLAMTEAMSAGLPVVGIKSCTAVAEIIENGKDGILTDDSIDAFALGLQKLMADDSLREKWGENAHISMKEYAPDKVWEKWDSLIQRLI
ncbi:glycosyltransferase [Dialister succinatiphilus]|uniref:glycosyltransferase n=1 Tax=Dialister succinatiphilus TaxID=487173 RepID=UPI004029521C